MRFGKGLAAGLALAVILGGFSGNVSFASETGQGPLGSLETENESSSEQTYGPLGPLGQESGNASGLAAGSSSSGASGPLGSYGEKDEIVIRMVGDDLIHARIFRYCQQADGSFNFDQLFEHVKKDIEEADIAIINQETIMVSNPADFADFPCFGTPESIGHSIVSAGFDVVAHANNHTMDRGYGGIQNTIDFWKNHYPDICYLGIHDTAEDSDIRYLTSNGIRVGFVNYTYGLNGFKKPRGREYCVDLLTDGGIEAVMGEARANCDLLIAVLHVGDEYEYTPTAYERQQVNRFIDLGADIVLCAHPHVLEPFGMVTTPAGRTGLVYYSLGNYLSAQNRLPRVLGGMADITVKKTGNGGAPIEITGYDLVPLVTHQQGPLVTTYRLDEYPDELAAAHNLVGLGFSKDAMWNLYTGITGKARP